MVGGTPGLAIRTDNLTRRFGDLRAVDGLTMDVPSGIVFGFLGPNGAGKTTTINLLLGLIDPTEGHADVLGLDTRTRAAEVRERVGVLLEDPGLYEQLSAEENLEYFARIWQLSTSERGPRIRELLEAFGFWERRRDRVATWSKGMKQKLAIARSLIHRPRLVFLDEPTAGLDVVSANELRRDLADLVAREGVTVFLTTHNMAEAERLCQLVAVIRTGKLLSIGNPDELRLRTGGDRLEVVGRGFSPVVLQALSASPAVAGVEAQRNRLVVDLESDADPASLVDLLVGAGAHVEEVRRGKASLEEVFLTLVEEER